MENETDNVATRTVIYKWARLTRQQSPIGTLAKKIVLPQNARRHADVANREMRTIQSQEQHQQQHEQVFIDDEPIDRKVEHFPIFMIGISVMQIILFYSFDKDLLTMNFGYDPNRRHEIWRFFTCMLVHSDYSHLWGNVVMQLILGVFLEIVHKWKRIGTIYMASVFGGSLCITVLDNTSVSIGASGGVMGLLFSHLTTIILNWNEMDRKFSRLFCVTLYIVYDVGITLYSELYLGKETNISHAGHFGGSVCGFLVSILVLKNFKKHPWEKTMQMICVGILIAIVVICVAINVTVPDYFPTNEWNFDYERTYNSTETTRTIEEQTKAHFVVEEKGAKPNGIGL